MGQREKSGGFQPHPWGWGGVITGARRRWVVAQLFGLTAEQVAGIRPFFPKEGDVRRVDDRTVLSSILYVTRRGLRGGCPGG